MKSFQYDGGTVTLTKDDKWHHPSEEVTELLNLDTQELEEDYSVACGTYREYIFRNILEMYEIQEGEFVDDEEPEHGPEGTTY